MNNGVLSIPVPGLGDDRVLSFPPCRLVFAEEVLLGGAGPRSSFGRDQQGRARAAWWRLVEMFLGELFWGGLGVLSFHGWISVDRS